MNFTHLLAFYEVARAGSVSAGAERLHVSQPAVTREIRELEQRVGLVLFDRLPRGVALTESGRVLFHHASRIFTLADAAEAEMKELAGIGKGHLNIGASATLGVYLVPGLISSFNAAYPRIGIDLTVSNTERVEAGLRDSRFSLGFVEGPFDASVLDARSIGSDEIAVIAAANHPLAGKTVQPDDLVDQVVIMREPGSGTRAIVEEAYAKRGLTIHALDVGQRHRGDQTDADRATHALLRLPAERHGRIAARGPGRGIRRRLAHRARAASGLVEGPVAVA